MEIEKVSLTTKFIFGDPLGFACRETEFEYTDAGGYPFESRSSMVADIDRTQSALYQGFCNEEALGYDGEAIGPQMMQVNPVDTINFFASQHNYSHLDTAWGNNLFEPDSNPMYLEAQYVTNTLNAAAFGFSATYGHSE